MSPRDPASLSTSHGVTEGCSRASQPGLPFNTAQPSYPAAL